MRKMKYSILLFFNIIFFVSFLFIFLIDCKLLDYKQEKKMNIFLSLLFYY